MKTTRAMHVISALFLSTIAFADGPANKNQIRKPPYIYCNVYLSDVCFGIAPGDRLSMEIPADYVVYRIAFSFGSNATVYVGGHPDASFARNKGSAPCNWTSGFKECSLHHDNDRVDFLARRDSKGDFVHIAIEGKADSAAIESFLKNVRPCSTFQATLSCPD